MNNNNQTKITVVDALMGAGKSSWAMDKINNDNKNKYIYITPYLDEIKRIKNNFEDNQNKKFYEPRPSKAKNNNNYNKLSGLDKLLELNLNIVATHALFRQADTRLTDMLEKNKYILILDEVMEVIEQLKVSKSDLNMLLNNKQIYLDDNNRVYWNYDQDDYKGEFGWLRGVLKNSIVICYKKQAIIWNFPVEIFNYFKEVYILTYMFDGQIQKYYYDQHNIEYDLKTLSTDKETGKNILLDYTNFDKSYLKSKINILDNEKMNEVGNLRFNLSSEWFEKNNKNVGQLKKNLYNYYKCINKDVKAKERLWTTFSKQKNRLSGSRNTEKCFLSCNTRATNQYIDTYVLAYCVNIFLNPMIKQYFNSQNILVDEDKYALSMMLQWLWRSRIRRGEPINIYIPSKRMRNLLISWLNNEI